MTADRVRELKQLIADLRDRYGFEEDRPDPVALAEAMHVRVRYFPLGDLRGFYLVLNDIPFIAIDRDIPEALQRVVCAHELGHHLLHHEEASRGFFDDYDLYRMENRFEPGSSGTRTSSRASCSSPTGRSRSSAAPKTGASP